MGPYEELANAIVLQAARDYRKSLKRKNKAGAREIERFFRSDWFAVLTSLEPEVLINNIKKEFLE